jgi:hypothetical protein
MGKPRHKHPLEDNPFVEGFLEWMDSPEGRSSIEISDALWELMEDVQLEARQRKIIWPDGEGLSIDQSVERIHKLYPKFPSQQILSFLITVRRPVSGHPVTCTMFRTKFFRSLRAQLRFGVLTAAGSCIRETLSPFRRAFPMPGSPSMISPFISQ